MAFLEDQYKNIKEALAQSNTTLVAVSKTKPHEAIVEAYKSGIKDFGENYVQELVEKSENLPKDIRWHFIGHLQTNKVKYIAPFVYLIHGVDSEKLLVEINKQGQKLNKKINCLLQIHIAQEETKFGLDETELKTILTKLPELEFINVMGFMGMASFTSEQTLIKKEFDYLKGIFDNSLGLSIANFNPSILSMGMSADYHLAVSCGSNMVRIGSLLFGERNKPEAKID